MRIFGSAFLISLAAVGLAYKYGGYHAAVVTVLLGVLEISLSVDNAIVNAAILEKMPVFWQRMFLTVGIVVAALGMRLLFPLLIVWASAGINPIAGIHLALHPPSDGSSTYAQLIQGAHPQIAAFGGIFLLLLFLQFIMTPQPRQWLSKIEKILIRIGALPDMAIAIALTTLLVIDYYCVIPEKKLTVLIAGILGVLCYIACHGLHIVLNNIKDDQKETPHRRAVFISGLLSFCYLEIIDASFAFDGVIGAFAITSDPIIILLGLGCIGAVFVRSVTVYLVKKKVLHRFNYLEHGAHWAIGALAILVLLSIDGITVSDLCTGSIGAIIIIASLLTTFITESDADS